MNAKSEDSLESVLNKMIVFLSLVNVMYKLEFV